MNLVIVRPESINGNTVAIAEPVQIGELPVVMVVTKDNKLVAPHSPDLLTIEKVREYLAAGHILRQVTHKELAKSSIKWEHEK